MHLLLCEAGVPEWKNLHPGIFSNVNSKGSEIIKQISRNHEFSVKNIVMFL